MAKADYDNSAGIDLYVAAEDTAGSDTYTAIFAMTTKDLSIPRPEIDVSNGSEGGWNMSIDGATRSITISGSGIITSNAAGWPKLWTIATASDNTWNFEVAGLADGTVITGCFRITDLSPTGAFDGAQEFNVTMISVGAPTFA